MAPNNTNRPSSVREEEGSLVGTALVVGGMFLVIAILRARSGYGGLSGLARLLPGWWPAVPAAALLVGLAVLTPRLVRAVRWSVLAVRAARNFLFHLVHERSVRRAPNGFRRYQGQGLPVGREPGLAGRILAYSEKRGETAAILLVGSSGSGKSSAMETMALHTVRRTRDCLIVIDPHATMALDILSRMTEEERARTQWVDLTGRGPTPSWNVLAAHALSDREAALRGQAVTDALTAVSGAAKAWHRQRAALAHSVEALISLNRQLPPEGQLSLFAIDRWLDDAEWRTALLPRLPERARRWWGRKISAADSGAVTGLVERMRAREELVRLLGGGRNDVDLAAIADGDGHLIVTPGTDSAGQAATNLLAYMLVNVGRARAHRPQGSLRPVRVLIDELPLLDAALGAQLGSGIRETRKYLMSWVLATQGIGSGFLSGETVDNLLTNRQLLMTAAVSSLEAQRLARDIGHDLEWQRIAGLAPHRWMVQVQRHAPVELMNLQASEPFGEAAPLPLPESWLPGTANVPDPEEAEDAALALLGPERALKAPAGPQEVPTLPAPAVGAEAPSGPVCALEECTVSLAGRAPDARYCCDAHRKRDGARRAAARRKAEEARRKAEEAGRGPEERPWRPRLVDGER